MIAGVAETPPAPVGAAPGSDATVLGGAGNDWLGGADGSQLMQGADGDDTLYAGVGDDNLDGGPGNDRLFPDVGFDRVEGGDGDDVIDGLYWGINSRPQLGDGFELGNLMDSFGCGPGNDTAIVDPVDLVRSDCENVGTRGQCTGDAEECRGKILLEEGGAAAGKSSNASARAAGRKRLGKGKFKAEGGELMDQVAGLNAKAAKLVARKGVVKVVATITCRATHKRSEPTTKVRKVRLTLVRDPTDPTQTQSPAGKLKRARC